MNQDVAGGLVSTDLLQDDGLVCDPHPAVASPVPGTRPMSIASRSRLRPPQGPSTPTGTTPTPSGRWYA